MRPNTMNKYGAVLDDFGLEAMLNQFMEQFIAPISRGCMYDCYIYRGLTLVSIMILILIYFLFDLQFFILKLEEEHWTHIMLLLLNMGKTGMLNSVSSHMVVRNSLSNCAYLNAIIFHNYFF
jgi:hypothetical protein